MLWSLLRKHCALTLFVVAGGWSCGTGAVIPAPRLSAHDASVVKGGDSGSSALAQDASQRGPTSGAPLATQDGGTPSASNDEVSLTVMPKSAQASVGGRVQLSASITGTTNTATQWAVLEGATGGLVSSTGEYTAPATVGSYHVVATSQQDPAKSDMATITVTQPSGTRPMLKVGVWTNISPPAVPYGQIGDIQTLAAGIAVDANNPSTLYECVDAFNSRTFETVQGGLWKSTDGGTSWKKSGNFDSPVRVAVDPSNSKHLYLTDGVRGNTVGFWVSNDGGDTWTQPQGFKTTTSLPTIASADTYSLAVDPADFRHVLLGFHYGWTDRGRYTDTAGVLESKDGGATWIAHPPQPGQTGLGFFVMFLSNPAAGIGNKDTWLLGTQASGFWKTTNAGTSWTQVSTNNMAHEGTSLFYAKTGAVYVGASGHPMRSTDNGSTWKILDGTPNGSYSDVQGDGNTLYIQPDGFAGPAQPFSTSAETDGLTWRAQGGSPQTFQAGPAEMAFDPVNKIIYASMYEAGVWALKVE